MLRMISIEGMNYRQWQKRNTEYFNRLNKLQQAESRKRGYRNIGWDRVQKSWKLVNTSNQAENEETVVPFKKPNNIASLFDHKLHKGDVVGALDLSILEYERASVMAKQALKELENNRNYLNKITVEALAKYQTM